MVADAKDVANSTIVVITLFGNKYIIVSGNNGEISPVIRIFETTFFKNWDVSKPIIFRRNEIRANKPIQETMMAIKYTVSGIASNVKAMYDKTHVDNIINDTVIL